MLAWPVVIVYLLCEMSKVQIKASIRHRVPVKIVALLWMCCKAFEVNTSQLRKNLKGWICFYGDATQFSNVCCVPCLVSGDFRKQGNVLEGVQQV